MRTYFILACATCVLSASALSASRHSPEQRSIVALSGKGALYRQEQLSDAAEIADKNYQVALLNEKCMHQRVYPQDMTRPIKDVFQENPEAEGLCLFAEGRGDALMQCSAAKHVSNFLGIAMLWGSNAALQSYMDEKRPLGFSHREFKTDYKFLAPQSAYCLQNGWLDRAKYSIDHVYDSNKISAIAAEECAVIKKEYPHVDELSWAFYLHNKRFFDKKDRTTMRLHALWSCFFGGLACDIANCAYNFCKLDNGFIGHGAQCRSDWLKEEDISQYWNMTGREKPHHDGPPETWMGDKS